LAILNQSESYYILQHLASITMCLTKS